MGMGVYDMQYTMASPRQSQTLGTDIHLPFRDQFDKWQQNKAAINIDCNGCIALYCRHILMCNSRLNGYYAVHIIMHSQFTQFTQHWLHFL